MGEGLAAHRDTALSLFRPFQLLLAADAQLRSGRLDESAQSLEEGFAIANRVGDRLAVAELHRIRGASGLLDDPVSSAGPGFREQSRLHAISVGSEIFVGRRA